MTTNLSYYSSRHSRGGDEAYFEYPIIDNFIDLID
jgi:hypothetical protein